MLIHVTTSLQAGVVRPPPYVAYLLPAPIAGRISSVRLNETPSGGKFVVAFAFEISDRAKIMGCRAVLFGAWKRSQ